MKNLKPFDMQATLTGKAVMLRDGLKAYVRHRETELSTKVDETLLGYVEGIGWWSWSACGKSCTASGESKYDIIGMYPETRIINGFEVPVPETEELEYGTPYYLASPSLWHFHTRQSWVGDTSDKFWLARGLVFLIVEDAVATAKAMLGIDPNEEDKQ